MPPPMFASDTETVAPGSDGTEQDAPATPDGDPWWFRPTQVAIVRYRYRGTRIPTPWSSPTTTAA